MSLADFEKFLTSFESIWNIKQHLHGYHLSMIHYQVLSLSCIPRRWQAYPRFCYICFDSLTEGEHMNEHNQVNSMALYMALYIALCMEPDIAHITLDSILVTFNGCGTYTARMLILKT